MPRRAATITQADVARVIRAARQEGAAEVEVRVGGKSSIVIRLTTPAPERVEAESAGEIVL